MVASTSTLSTHVRNLVVILYRSSFLRRALDCHDHVGAFRSNDAANVT